MSNPITIFTIYAREDKDFKDRLLSHLQPLQKPFNATIWQDDYIRPGEEWRIQIKAQLEKTDVFILLVSVDFMNSPFINQTEFEYAIQKHRAKKAVVIPVIIRHCMWDLDIYLNDGKINLSELQVLPSNINPIEEWASSEAAYNDVATGIRSVLQSLTQGTRYEKPSSLVSTNQHGHSAKPKANLIVPDQRKQPKLSRNSLIAFILAFITAACAIIWGPSIVGSDKAIIYLLILVPLAFAPAILLFRTLKSYNSNDNSGFSNKMEFFGPIGIFVLVITSGFIFYQNPPTSVQDLSIMIYDKNGGSLLTGKIIIKYRNKPEEIPINNSRGMYPNVKTGDPIVITTSFDGYNNIEFDTVVTKLGEALELTIEKDVEYLKRVSKLRYQFIYNIDSYVVSANDIIKSLDSNIERLLTFDAKTHDEAEEEVIKFSNIYANVYYRLINGSDSLILAINENAKSENKDFDKIYKRATQFHKEHFRKYNDFFQVDINNYILAYNSTGKQDRNDKQKIITEIKQWAGLAKLELATIEKEFESIKDKLKL